MARRLFAPGWLTVRAGIAVVVSVTTATAVGALAPPAAADPLAEVVIPASQRSAELTVSLASTETSMDADGAGAQGVFHRLEGHSGVVWTRYADGRTFPVFKPEGTNIFATPTGSDTLAYRVGDQIVFWDAVHRTTGTVDVPEGHSSLGIFGTTVVTSSTATAGDGTTVRTLHLLTAEADGTTRDVAVEGMPAGSLLGGPVTADEKDIVFAARIDGQRRMVLVDFVTGRVESWTAPLPDGYHHAVLTGSRLAVYSTSQPAVLTVPRTDLSAAPAEVRLDGGAVQPTSALAAVGDWLVYRRSASAATATIKAVPVAGGEPVTVLDQARPWISAAPGDTAVVVARSNTGDWALQRLAADGDGRPVATVFKPLPRPPLTIQGITLSHGRLVVTDNDSGADHRQRKSWIRTLPATGTPEAGERTQFVGPDTLIANCPAQDVGCSQVLSPADGRIAWLNRGTDGTDRLYTNSSGRYEYLHDYFFYDLPPGGQITDVSGNYLIHTTADRQTVVKFNHYGSPVLTRAPGAAAVWGDLLWTPGSTPGTVTAYDLAAKKTVHTVDTGTGCAPEELQAVGRWLYVKCGGTALPVVYDRTTRATVTVPSGEALLGDGYLVTHDRASGQLTLTTVTGGTATSRVIGELPDTGRSQRHVRWTVDEFGGHAAWVDDQERVHIVPSGVPTTQPLTSLGTDNAAGVWAKAPGTTPDRVTSVLLSKPAAGWTLTVRDAVTGRTVDTVTGGPARGRLDVGWHGTDLDRPGDTFLPNGRYAWTLSITPADGIGADLKHSGTVELHDGSPVRHDHAGDDGLGDLLTLNSTGGLTFHMGSGAGKFGTKISASGWPTSVVAVPFGDLDGDRCNDVLVRMADGSLRGYRPGCGQAVKPSTPYKALGTGWGAYNVLTSPGDLTGDGRADLLARKSSTGDIHLFAAKSDGTLAAGKKIRSAWTSYTKVVGAGDLNGDGHGDVLAHHKDGTLYRYDGTGTGLLKERVTVFTNWGASYNTVVGVGDITGDGKADIVVRDKNNVLYRNDGKGNGTFTSRTQIATGWSYKGIF